MKDKYKILLVTGVVTTEHDPKVNYMLRRLLESTGRFEVKITEEFKGATAETVEGYDALLINYDGKHDVHAPFQPLGDTAVQTITEFVKNGGGVIMYHSTAITMEPLYPQSFREMIGSTFGFDDGGRKNPKLAFRVDTVHGDPITEGVADFWYTAQDDLFVNSHVLPGSNIRVLATVYDGEEDYDFRRMQKHIARMYEGMVPSELENINRDVPVIWTNTYGKGRVFVSFIGHGPDTIRRAEFVAMMARGCEWACSGAVTIPIPDIQEERRLAGWPYYDNVSLETMGKLTECL